MSPGDFEPAEDDLEQPTAEDDVICPRCGEYPFHLIQGKNAVVLELEGGAYWPYPPAHLFATRGEQSS